MCVSAVLQNSWKAQVLSLTHHFAYQASGSDPSLDESEKTKFNERKEEGKLVLKLPGYSSDDHSKFTKEIQKAVASFKKPYAKGDEGTQDNWDNMLQRYALFRKKEEVEED